MTGGQHGQSKWDASGIQRLNPVDLALRYVDRALRSMGYPGFETQMFVWLKSRADVTHLGQAIERLSHNHPVVAARLCESGDQNEPHVIWRYRPGAVCPLDEIELRDSTSETVLETASRLLSTPKDPAQFDPLRFHLFHLPDGRDVLLMQYSHMLMDNNASRLLLRHLDQLGEPGGIDLPVRKEIKNPITEYLRRYPLSRRQSATDQTLHLQGRVLRGRAAVLGRGDRSTTSPPTLRFATRQFDAEQALQLRNHVVQVCGLPSVSMALLACVFRAIDRIAPDQRAAGRNFVAGIGLDLGGFRNAHGPFFQNIMSLVPVYAQPDQLDDRDELIRLLSEQMRQRLESGIDLGILRLAAVFSRRPRYLQWVIEHLVRYGYSLWYAFFGSLDAAGDQFCGAEIENIFYTGPTWSPVGLTLLANQYHGRLLLQATYDPDLVPQPMVDQFLDFILDDLPE